MKRCRWNKQVYKNFIAPRTENVSLADWRSLGLLNRCILRLKRGEKCFLLSKDKVYFGLAAQMVSVHNANGVIRVCAACEDYICEFRRLSAAMRTAFASASMRRSRSGVKSTRAGNCRRRSETWENTSQLSHFWKVSRNLWKFSHDFCRHFSSPVDRTTRVREKARLMWYITYAWGYFTRPVKYVRGVTTEECMYSVYDTQRNLLLPSLFSIWRQLSFWQLDFVVPRLNIGRRRRKSRLSPEAEAELRRGPLKWEDEFYDFLRRRLQLQMERGHISPRERK